MLEITSGQAARNIQASKFFQNKSLVREATHVFALLPLMYRELNPNTVFLYRQQTKPWYIPWVNFADTISVIWEVSFMRNSSEPTSPR